MRITDIIALFVSETRGGQKAPDAAEVRMFHPALTVNEAAAVAATVAKVA